MHQNRLGRDLGVRLLDRGAHGGDRGQIGQGQEALDILEIGELDIPGFADVGRHAAEAEADHHAQGHVQQLVRRTGFGGRGGRRIDMGIRLTHGLLRRGFLHPRQHSLVELLRGVGIALEFVQLDAGGRAFDQLAFYLADGLLDRNGAAMGDLDLGRQVGNDPIDFALNLGVDILELRLRGLQIGVLGAIAAFHVGHLRRKLRALRAQGDDGAGAQRLADVLAVRSALKLLLGGLEAGLGLGLIRLRERQLLVDQRYILLRHGGGGGIDAEEAVGGLILLDRGVRGLDLLAHWRRASR